MSLLNAALGDGAIILSAEARDWESAVRIAGSGLEASGRSTAGYTEAMVEAIRELGPYVVIAPGIAMPHARPSSDVLATGMSLVILAEPVNFGHSKNDPVNIVFGLAALDHDRHLELLSEFAGKFAQDGFVNSLLSCSTEGEIRALFSSGLRD